MKRSAWVALGLLAMAGGVACGPSQAELASQAKAAADARAKAEAKAEAEAAKPKCKPRTLPIPAGTFMMGSNDRNDERPVHEVAVAAFCMDRTEVTVAAYAACVKAGKCTAADTDERCNSGKAGRENHPINCVEFNQAVRYCEARGKRLPTEEEWEYAARGTDGREYPWGNDAPSNQLCWNRYGDGKPNSTCPVGAYPKDRSPFGVLDMAGNVHELTSSPWTGDFASPPDASLRVFRGGGWDRGLPSNVRSARRGRSAPSFQYRSLGFRCAGSPLP